MKRPQLPSQDVGFTTDDVVHTDELPKFSPGDSNESSIDTTCESRFIHSIWSLLKTLKAFKLELLVQIYVVLMVSNQNHHLETTMRKSFKRKPPKVSCIMVKKPGASSNQLNQGHKLDVINDSCHWTWTLQCSSDVYENPYVYENYIIFRKSVQSTLCGCSEQKKAGKEAVFTENAMEKFTKTEWRKRGHWLKYPSKILFFSQIFPQPLHV